MVISDFDRVRLNGVMIDPDMVKVTENYGCRVKILITPDTGSALTACQVMYLSPGDMYPVHLHPVSEDVIIVFKGRGEVFVGDRWYEVEEGDVIYSPEYVKHGVRNPSSNENLFICYNWQVPYISDFNCLPGAKDQFFDVKVSPAISLAWRGKFDARIPDTGFISHINCGALFVEYGAPMRFIVWPGMGARKVSLHRAEHPPGFEFKVHVHPDAEDTILAFRGNGQGYLGDRWIDMKEGYVLYAPKGVKHGTRNQFSTGTPFICTGAAAPPQSDLYRLAGYL